MICPSCEHIVNRNFVPKGTNVSFGGGEGVVLLPSSVVGRYVGDSNSLATIVDSIHPRIIALVHA